MELTLFNNGQQIGNQIDVNRGVQSADLTGIDKGTDVTVLMKTVDTSGNVSKGITVNSRDFPSFALSANGNAIKEGDTFDDDLPLNFKVWDNLYHIKSAKVTVDGKDYPVDLQTNNINIDLAGNLGAKTANIIIDDPFGNSLQETWTFHVSTSLNSIKQLIARFTASGELTRAMIPQLSNAVDQAQHQLDIGYPDHAIEHMQDFTKLLNNEAFSNDMKDSAKAILNTDAESLINTWQNTGAN